MFLTRWMTASAALGATVLLACGAMAILAPIWPFTGFALQVAYLVFGLLGFAAAAFVSAAPAKYTTPATKAGGSFLLSIAPVSVGLAVLTALVSVGSGLNVQWAMRNDAVWNLMTARFIIADRGVVESLHPNSSALTATGMAMYMAPGRFESHFGNFLASDTTKAAAFWLLLTLVTAVLAGAVAFRALSGRAMWVRTIASFGVALVPVGYFFAGNAFQFGFFNASVVMVILLGSWLVWCEFRSAPRMSMAALSAGSLALLAAWAPLAIVPLGLAALTLVGVLSGKPRWRSARYWAGWVPGPVAVAVYGLLITVPDLRRDGGALAANGAVVDLKPTVVLLVASIAIVSAVALMAIHRTWVMPVGIGMVLACSSVALFYLRQQRVAAGMTSWGYYTTKYAWLVVTLLIIISLVGILAAMTGPGANRRTSGLALVATGLLGGSLLVQVPGTPANAIPIAEIMSPSTQEKSLLTDLNRFSSDKSKNLVAQYDSPGADLFMNNWLLQIHAERGNDEIRAFAYTLDGTTVDQICRVVSVWKTEVTVHTRNPGLPADLRNTCDSSNYKVIVDD